MKKTRNKVFPNVFNKWVMNVVTFSILSVSALSPQLWCFNDFLQTVLQWQHFTTISTIIISILSALEKLDNFRFFLEKTKTALRVKKLCMCTNTWPPVIHLFAMYFWGLESPGQWVTNRTWICYDFKAAFCIPKRSNDCVKWWSSDEPTEDHHQLCSFPELGRV